jgi:ABC-type transporter Mla MlaB component
MAKKFYLKETDSEIALKLNGDLSGSTVRTLVRPTDVSDPSLADELPTAITTPTSGIITVDTSGVAVGTYFIEVEQTQAGKLAHYPSRGYDLLIVGADL